MTANANYAVEDAIMIDKYHDQFWTTRFEYLQRSSKYAGTNWQSLLMTGARRITRQQVATEWGKRAPEKGEWEDEYTYSTHLSSCSACIADWWQGRGQRLRRMIRRRRRRRWWREGGGACKVRNPSNKSSWEQQSVWGMRISRIRSGILRLYVRIRMIPESFES